MLQKLKAMQESTDADATVVGQRFPRAATTSLVRSLGASATESTQEQLDGLINLTWHSSKHVNAIIEANGLPMLVQLLTSKNKRLVQGSAWVIANISADSVKARDACLEHGALPALLQALQNGPVPKPCTVGWAMWNLLADPRPPIQAVGMAIPILHTYVTTCSVVDKEHRLRLRHCLNRLVAFCGKLTAGENLYLRFTPTWPNNRRPSPQRRAVVHTLLTLSVRLRNAGLLHAKTNGCALAFHMSRYEMIHILGFLEHPLMF